MILEAATRNFFLKINCCQKFHIVHRNLNVQEHFFYSCSQHLTLSEMTPAQMFSEGYCKFFWSSFSAGHLLKGCFRNSLITTSATFVKTCPKLIRKCIKKCVKILNINNKNIRLIKIIIFAISLKLFRGKYIDHKSEIK